MARKPPLSETDSRCFDPFREPLWRLAWTMEIVEGSAALTPNTDPLVRELVAFYRELRQPRSEAMSAGIQERYPDLLSAYTIYTEKGIDRDELEARLLAEQDAEDIATKMGIRAQAVTHYSTVYFDSRDYRVARALSEMAIWGGRTQVTRDLSEGDMWRYVGQNWPPILDHVIEDFKTLPETPSTTKHKFAEYIRLAVRFFLMPHSDPRFQRMVEQLHDGAVNRAIENPGGNIIDCIQAIERFKRPKSPRKGKKQPVFGDPESN